jgi:hypothetical protein
MHFEKSLPEVLAPLVVGTGLVVSPRTSPDVAVLTMVPVRYVVQPVPVGPRVVTHQDDIDIPRLVLRRVGRRGYVRVTMMLPQQLRVSRMPFKLETVVARAKAWLMNGA